MTSKASKSKDETIEDKYKKMTPHEHVLALPDTYIGSISPDQAELWIVNGEKMELKQITFVPGLYKIYDEILINARDQAMREGTCKMIKINFNQKNGEISVYNDGPGIDIAMHPKHKVYVPEMIFGQLLTSTNYEKKGKTWGGKNGIGAKAANIFSCQFTVETVDAKVGKKYVQVFKKNMFDVGKPIITDVGKSVAPYTKISFIPDYERFGINGLTDDMLGLFKKRVYDLAACTYKNIKVCLDDKPIVMTKFNDYVQMFCSTDNIKANRVVYTEANDHWKIAVVYNYGSDRGFNHMSFVNGIWTYSQTGGTHVAHVVDQLTKGLIDYIRLEHKGVNVKASYLKESMVLFIDCVIEDPAFTSQTKEQLTSKASDFKPKKCEISNNFIIAVAKTGIVEDAVALAQMKDTLALKKLNGKKTSKIRVDKHSPALWAGTKKSRQCRLIIIEGDSAKPLALAGRAVIGQEKYGVFPIRGKMLNVREATKVQQQNNEEIKSIVQIMGLKFGTVYTEVNMNKLNYGGILILTDQDPDGSHIKGLIMNFIHYYWPSLLKINGFMQTMSTPLVKAFKNTDRKNKNPTVFYSLTEYNEWKKKQGVNINKWHTKYYKGLGSSEEYEQQEVFMEFEKKLMSFVWETETDKPIDKKIEDDDDDMEVESNTETDAKSSEDDVGEVEDTTSKSYDAMMVAFSKQHISDRKKMVSAYHEDIHYDPINQEIPYSEFVNKEWVHFASYDTQRSIPSMCDGLKPGQRKILFTMFKKKNYTESKPVKVAVLAGAVTETSNYLHGEKSLEDAIVGMAQNFPGSNNINILYPAGSFGTRLLGGKDASASRYIHTYLPEITYKIFRSEDEPIYEYTMDDGTYYEPKTYSPIIPMILVNGGAGIGTGYSSDVPAYNPKEIIENIIRFIDGKEPKPLLPWYKGHFGQIVTIDDYRNESHGKYNIIDEHTIRITELPVKVWTEKYEDFIRSMEIGYKDKKMTVKKERMQCLSNYTNTSLPNTIDFTLTFEGHSLQQLIKHKRIESEFKLVSRDIATSNMYLFNSKGMLKKYDNPMEILKEFCDFRLAIYRKRKEYHSRILKNELDIIEYKIKFLKEVIKKTIHVANRKKAEVIQVLVEHKYPMLSKDINAIEPSDKNKDIDKDEDDGDAEKTETRVVYRTYKYITDLPLFSMTDDKLAELTTQCELKKAEYEKYANTPTKELWREELIELTKVYDKWLKEELEAQKKNATKRATEKKIIKKQKVD